MGFRFCDPIVPGIGRDCRPPQIDFVGNAPLSSAGFVGAMGRRLSRRRTGSSRRRSTHPLTGRLNRRFDRRSMQRLRRHIDRRVRRCVRRSVARRRTRRGRRVMRRVVRRVFGRSFRGVTSGSSGSRGRFRRVPAGSRPEPEGGLRSRFRGRFRSRRGGRLSRRDRFGRFGNRLRGRHQRLGFVAHHVGAAAIRAPRPRDFRQAAEQLVRFALRAAVQPFGSSSAARSADVARRLVDARIAAVMLEQPPLRERPSAGRFVADGVRFRHAAVASRLVAEAAAEVSRPERCVAIVARRPDHVGFDLHDRLLRRPHRSGFIRYDQAVEAGRRRPRRSGRRPRRRGRRTTGHGDPLTMGAGRNGAGDQRNHQVNPFHA